MEIPAVVAEAILEIFFLENRLERIFQFSGLDKPFPVKVTIDGFEKLIKVLHRQFIEKSIIMVLII